LCRIAGELGGVAAIYLHLVFEKYAIQIEQATTTDYLEHVVTPNMFAEYCDLVANYSTLKYSPLIKEIVIFIGNHLREELNVSNLAATFHVNSSHLARKFKKETGYTISEYVNHQKIEAAKLLFQGGEVTVGEVSEKLGYNSNSYFSKIFKKITGKSPVVYLKSLHN
jgi:YesN/AraC family two-component response regulator